MASLTLAPAVPAPRDGRGAEPTAPLGDWALVAAAQAGDREAFAELYRRHHGRVRAYVRRNLNDPSRVDDLTSETFVRVLRRIGGVEDRGYALASWLLWNAKCVLVRHQERAHVRYEVATDELPEPTGTAQADGPEARVLAQFDREAIALAVGAGLDRLCPSQRRCVQLYDLEELPLGQVTTALGRTDQAVYSMRKRARHQLAEELDPEGAAGSPDRLDRAIERARTAHACGRTTKAQPGAGRRPVSPRRNTRPAVAPGQRRKPSHPAGRYASRQAPRDA